MFYITLTSGLLDFVLYVEYVIYLTWDWPTPQQQKESTLGLFFALNTFCYPPKPLFRAWLHG